MLLGEGFGKQEKKARSVSTRKEYSMVSFRTACMGLFFAGSLVLSGCTVEFIPDRSGSNIDVSETGTLTSGIPSDVDGAKDCRSEFVSIVDEGHVQVLYSGESGDVVRLTFKMADGSIRNEQIETDSSQRLEVDFVGIEFADVSLVRIDAEGADGQVESCKVKL